MRPFRSNAVLYLTKSPYELNGPADVTEDPAKAALLLVGKGGVLDLDEADKFNLVGGQYDFGAHPYLEVPTGAGEGGGEVPGATEPGTGFVFTQPQTESAPEQPAASAPSDAAGVDAVADAVAAATAEVSKKK